MNQSMNQGMEDECINAREREQESEGKGVLHRQRGQERSPPYPPPTIIVAGGGGVL